MFSFFKPSKDQSIEFMRNAVNRIGWHAAKQGIELAKLNRAIARKGRNLRNLRAKHNQLVEATIALRMAQRDYLAAKWRDPRPDDAVMAALGQEVGKRAAMVDMHLPPYTEEDRAISAKLGLKARIMESVQ